MTSTYLEQVRTLHEDVERYQARIVHELTEKAKTHRERVYQNQRIRKLIDMGRAKAISLIHLHGRQDPALQEEIAQLSQENAQRLWTAFTSRVADVRLFHAPNPDERVPDPDADIAHLYGAGGEFGTSDAIVEFSGEERYGRNVDLHLAFEMYTNLRGLAHHTGIDYVTYLDEFRNFSPSPAVMAMRRYRGGREYLKYLSGVLEYLQDFHQRSQPLEDPTEMLRRAEDDFQDKWAAKQVIGWQVHAEDPERKSRIDLREFHNAEELASVLGLDGLKEELMTRGLKCGGTLMQRAERLFSIRGLSDDQIPASLKAPVPGGASNSSANGGDAEEVTRMSALLEARIGVYCDLLHDKIENTKLHTERKQVRTFAEMEAEQEEEEMEDQTQQPEEEEEEDDGVIYNPKNLPLDATGRPIPYWLYKLHGLNLEYKCEICGNQSYWGPRNFERHFQEWRHQYGMRCLRIPNTRHFHHVTKITEALTLYEKLKKQTVEDTFRPDTEEEFEDANGNVIPRKTFELMKKQGLL